MSAAKESEKPEKITRSITLRSRFWKNLMWLNSNCLLTVFRFGRIIASDQRGYNLVENNPREEKGYES
jgi:hypothetical protein